MPIRLRLSLCVFLLILLTAALWLSSLDLVEIPFRGTLWILAGDKVLHSIAFFAISGLMCTALHSVSTIPVRSALPLTIAASLTVSVVNEVIQIASPSRDSVSGLDMAADASGYLAGSVAFAVVHILRSQRRRIPRY